VHLQSLLQRFATTAAAVAAGVSYAVMHPGDSRVELKPGDPAPDFSLAGSDGRTYRLKDLAGRPVVIAWFPKAFTGGCTAECTSLASSDEALRQLDVSYFAASVDTSETNTRFATSLGIGYPILSDPTKEVARAYGVLASSGFASRWTFYIGADGRILDIDKKVRPAFHGREVVARLNELRVQR
jgi:peroxiredoxin Q/BCP